MVEARHKIIRIDQDNNAGYSVKWKKRKTNKGIERQHLKVNKLKMSNTLKNAENREE